MNIDELFTETAVVRGDAAQTVADSTVQAFDDSIEYAGAEHTHMFVFRMETSNHSYDVPGNLKWTLDMYYEKLKSVISAVSLSDVACYLAYTKKAYEYIDRNYGPQIAQNQEWRVDDLHAAYDLTECPVSIIELANKDYIEYHLKYYTSLVEPTRYFLQYYIIFKCRLRKNMWAVLRLLYGIWEALDENEGCHHFRPELVVLRNRNSRWETIMKGIVKFDDIQRVYMAGYYTKNLEDMFVFLYKDMFYDKDSGEDTVALNRRLIYRFKKMINRRGWKRYIQN